MAKFKCKDTGCVYEFTYEHDIKTMREHHQYEEVVEVEEAPKAAPAKKTTKAATEE